MVIGISALLIASTLTWKEVGTPGLGSEADRFSCQGRTKAYCISPQTVTEPVTGFNALQVDISNNMSDCCGELTQHENSLGFLKCEDRLSDRLQRPQNGSAIF
jgi:hypothetical protein